MKTNSENTNKSSSTENPYKNDSKATFQFFDNRPKAVAQRKLQELANNNQNPRAFQMRQFQEMANNHAGKKSLPSSSQTQDSLEKKNILKGKSAITQLLGIEDVETGEELIELTDQNLFDQLPDRVKTALMHLPAILRRRLLELPMRLKLELINLTPAIQLTIIAALRQLGLPQLQDERNQGALVPVGAPQPMGTPINIELLSPDFIEFLFGRNPIPRWMGGANMQALSIREGEQMPEPKDEGSIPTISSKDYDVLKILDSGSTKPQHVKFKETGVEKVLKFGKDQGHLLTEVLSNKLYEKAGIPTLRIELVKVDGKLAQMTDFVKEFKTPEEEDLVSTEDFLRHLGADMLFANWDLFKTDNWMQLGGRMIRADNGGALDRSAQGHMKEEGDWDGKQVKDIDSMRTKKNSPYRHATDHEAADSIYTLSKILTPKKIEEAFEESHYPLMLRAKMRQTLLERMKIALGWADKTYSIDTSVTVDHLWDTGEELRLPKREETVDQTKKVNQKGNHASSPTKDSDELSLELLKLTGEDEINYAEQLTQEGFTNVPKNAPAWLIGEMLRSGFIQPPEPKGKTGNPHESIPMVGPEELTREDQFGKGLAKKMPEFFSRMVTGRLVRRMSDGERGAFEKAAKSRDIFEILNLIFPPTGKPGARGEMVWSVNKPFVFEREIALMKGVEYTGKEEAHDPKDYHWVMEIFITDEMLKFLQDYAYINNPTGGGKPSAFMGNPTLKLEGQAGGKGGEDGIPNVVLKKDGFAKFWRGVESFQFVKAEDHLWKYASDNKELLQIRENKRIKERIEAAKSQKEFEELIRKSKIEEENDYFGGHSIFDDSDDEEQEVVKEVTTYDIILEEFQKNNPDQLEAIKKEGHGGLLHNSNSDAPLSSKLSHIELRKKYLKESTEKRQEQTIDLNKWFAKNKIEIAHNKGSGLNCLIISLLMHASGRYEDVHDELATHYRSLLVKEFKDIDVSQMLYSDNLAYAWLVAEINKDYGVSLDVQFVKSNEGLPYLVPAISTGNSKVVIVDYGGHYEALHKKQ